MSIYVHISVSQLDLPSLSRLISLEVEVGPLKQPQKYKITRASEPHSFLPLLQGSFRQIPAEKDWLQAATEFPFTQKHLRIWVVALTC